MKDHYKTLGVPSHATPADIRKAYRSLALRHHPDKDQQNPHAASRFLEIQEAWHILGDTKRKKLYDEERYFAGLSSQKEPLKVTAGWVLKKLTGLQDHMAGIDSYRMNHKALYEYTLLLLSDDHLEVLKEDPSPELPKQVIRIALTAIGKLDYPYFIQIIPVLTKLAGNDKEAARLVEQALVERKKAAFRDKSIPVIILVAVLALCVIMYLYSMHK